MLLLQAIQEYVKEHHPDWQTSKPHSDTLMLKSEKYTIIWLYFHELPTRNISIQCYNIKEAQNTNVEYNENNILEIIDNTIYKAEEHYRCYRKYSTRNK